ncbi:MAG: hypothetical protein HY717_15265 [Planctomycetes bacterium]|nr:hypothetical protein [Planctomycetota bacterium]
MLIGDYTWGAFSDVDYDHKALFDALQVRKAMWTAVLSGGHFNYMDDSLDFRATPTPDKRAALHRRIAIRRNRFESAGGRAVNIGGSTGLEYFRPPLPAGGERWEAKEIEVAGNTFIGGGAAVAFVGVDGAAARFNTIYRPKRWALRILQENRASGFVPSRRGEFTDNLIAFHSSEWAEGGVNIGPDTAPETFQFARNWWFCLDQQARSRPKLPVGETDGAYGKDPLFQDAASGDLRLRPDSPARQVGAAALPRAHIVPVRGIGEE